MYYFEIKEINGFIYFFLKRNYRYNEAEKERWLKSIDLKIQSKNYSFLEEKEFLKKLLMEKTTEIKGVDSEIEIFKNKDLKLYKIHSTEPVSIDYKYKKIFDKRFKINNKYLEYVILKVS